MGRTRNNLVEEARSNLSSWVVSFTRGWRRLIPIAVLLTLVVLFGLGATLMILVAFLGISGIIAVFSANNRWIEKEASLRKRPRKKKVKN